MTQAEKIAALEKRVAALELQLKLMALQAQPYRYVPYGAPPQLPYQPDYSNARQ